MDFSHLNQMALGSGGTLYLMAVLVFVGLTVIIDRGLRIRRNVRRGAQLVHDLSTLPTLGQSDVERLREQATGLPLARLFDVYAVRHTAPNLDELLEEAIYMEIPQVDRGLWLLDTVITVAPLLGLFGTIIGMFNAFGVLGQNGGDTSGVTAGVAEALVATACGLAIAMSHLWFFNGMNDAVRQIVHQMETVKRQLLNRLPGVHKNPEHNGLRAKERVMA
ncbi:biopolymer transport protein ExbB [Silvimonas terrae]|uniref:Biopolymer transport protein ExbB n=1 Tax=Silvimonas terrae TaxID=300266 RepID=A0A840RKJ3_9NEIS|nr:MotA/TolQ/ExbB proton channel family protein [Silvimonas terrae]MBB5193677.1 biopolymer transport protein ExbB [Silvimonas terrae]